MLNITDGLSLQVFVGKREAGLTPQGSDAALLFTEVFKLPNYNIFFRCIKVYDTVYFRYNHAMRKYIMHIIYIEVSYSP